VSLSGVEYVKPKRYIELGTTIESLLTHVPRTPGSHKQGPPEGFLTQEELDVRAAFAHFLNGLLCLNPDERWTPREAAQHPFITKQEWQGYFMPEEDPTHPAREAASQAAMPSPPPLPNYLGQAGQDFALMGQQWQQASPY